MRDQNMNDLVGLGFMRLETYTSKLVNMSDLNIFLNEIVVINL